MIRHPRTHSECRLRMTRQGAHGGRDGELREVGVRRGWAPKSWHGASDSDRRFGLARGGVMRVERLSSIGQVDEAAWRAIEPPDFPFFDLEFLRALERSRSVGRRSGWSPVYLVCQDGERILGALPM